MENLDKLIRFLLSENSSYDDISVPDKRNEKRQLLRALLNVRPPHPISREFVAGQNEELQKQLLEKGIPGNVRLK